MPRSRFISFSPPFTRPCPRCSAAGVEPPGRYTIGQTTSFSFLRATNGVAVSVTNETPFVVSSAGALNSEGVVIWVGRNGVGWMAQTQVEGDISNMVASLNGNPNYLILSVINFPGETNGTANYEWITNLNATLATTYGLHFLDLREYLVQQTNGSAADAITLAGDDIANSLVITNNGHLNHTGYQLAGQYVAAYWMSNVDAGNAIGGLVYVKPPAIFGSTNPIGVYLNSSAQYGAIGVGTVATTSGITVSNAPVNIVGTGSLSAPTASFKNIGIGARPEGWIGLNIGQINGGSGVPILTTGMNVINMQNAAGTGTSSLNLSGDGHEIQVTAISVDPYSDNGASLGSPSSGGGGGTGTHLRNAGVQLRLAPAVCCPRTQMRLANGPLFKPRQRTRLVFGCQIMDRFTPPRTSSEPSQTFSLPIQPPHQTLLPPPWPVPLQPMHRLL